VGDVAQPVGGVPVARLAEIVIQSGVEAEAGENTVMSTDPVI